MVKSGGRGAQRKDPAWKHGVQVEGERGYVYIKCNYCNKIIKGGVKRMKDHIGGTHKNVMPCSKAPEDAKQECLEFLKKFASARHVAQENFEERVDSGSYFRAPNPMHENQSSGHGSCSGPSGSIQTRGIRGPMDRFMKDVVVETDNGEITEIPSEKAPTNAKEQIAKNLGGELSAYKEIWAIIDERWDNQLHRDLHGAGYFLNPRFQYSDTFDECAEVKRGLYNCLERLIIDEDDQRKADFQIDAFRLKQGLFGRNLARTSFEHRSPGNWWMQFGDETPELKSFAVRVLSLTCSASACERNWSTFNQVHTKRRNRLDAKRMNNLVYIMYNKKLKDRHLKLKSLKEDDDPLAVEDLASDDEWIVEEGEHESHGDERGESSSASRKRPSEIQGSQTNQRKGKGKVQNVAIEEEEEWDDVESDDEDEAIDFEDTEDEDEDDD